MGNRRINLLLWSIAALSVSAGLSVGAALAMLPMNLLTMRGPVRDISAATMPSPTDAKAEVLLAGRTFRVSVSSSATATAPAAPAVSDVAAIQLVGTIGDSIAMLRGPDGTTALMEVGDDVNGAAILAIRPFQVDLKLNGRTTTLVKADGSDSNATDPNAVAWPSQP